MNKIYFFLFTFLLVVNYSIFAQTDANIDTSFNSGTGFNNDVIAIATQTDGKIIIGGSFTTYQGISANRIIRLNSDGSIDNTFVYGTGFNNSVSDISIQTDGKIIIVGYFSTYKGGTVNRIVKLNSNGSVDTSFTTVGSSTAMGIRNITKQADNRLLISRIFTTSGGSVINNDIVRLNINGTIDATFSTGSGFESSVNSIKVAQDGKIYVAGDFLTYQGNSLTTKRIIRLNADGTRDTTFSLGGTGYSGTVIDIALQSDGKIISGGTFLGYNGSVNKYYINRLETTGNDDNFGLNGFAFNSGVIIRSIAIQNDGKILIGGEFLQHNGINIQRIIRLNNDATGTRDINFLSGNGFDDDVKIIHIQQDGKILIGGYFTSYNGTTANRIIRLKGTPTLSNEDFEKNKINIYPNPVKETIYTSNITDVEFEIFNILGKSILKGKTNENQINVNSLSKGIYILKLKKGDVIFNQKFIKE